MSEHEPSGGDGGALPVREVAATPAALPCGGEAALACLREYYAPLEPEAVEWMLLLARGILDRAATDRAMLDVHARDRSQAPVPFRLDVPAVLESVRVLAERRQQAFSAGKRPMDAAMLRGEWEDAADKRALHDFRETLRDGWEPARALELHADVIAGRAAACRVFFFESLGVILKEYRLTPAKYERTLSDWMVRLWLPLALWECPADGNEAFARVCAAASLMGGPVPSLTAFLNAWKNVRSRIFRPVLQFISQSAAAD